MRTLLLSIVIALQIPAFAQRGMDLIDFTKFKIKKLSVIDVDRKMQWVHFYNERGQILKTESATGQLLSEYIYNNNGLLTETKTYSWSGSEQTLTRTEKNSYDAKNRLVKLVTDENNNIENWTYEYDDKGNKTRATKRANGTIASITMYQYVNGKVVEERLSDPQGLLGKTTYKYDANGLLINKRWVDSKRPSRTETWKYKYDASGKLVEEQYLLGQVDAGNYRYKYTSNGLLESYTVDGYGEGMKTVFVAEFY